MKQRRDRGPTHAEVLETERHPAEDAGRPEDDQDDGLLRDLGADDRADVRFLADFVDGAELVFQREAQLAEFAFSGQVDRAAGSR
jgi:hypothetical protein